MGPVSMDFKLKAYGFSHNTMSLLLSSLKNRFFPKNYFNQF